MEIKLEVITDDTTVANACRLYWAMDDGGFVHTIKEVAQQTSIPCTKVSSTVRACCHATSENVVCELCSSGFVYQSRSDYSRRNSRHKSSWVCDRCRDEQRRQEAERQRIANENEEKEKRALLVKAREERRHDKVDLDSLSATLCVQLLALLRHAADEQIVKIGPLSRVRDGSFLTVGGEFDRDLMVNLYRSGLIAIHPDTDLQSIVIKPGQKFAFSPERVLWTLTSGNEEGAIDFYKALDQYVQDERFLSTHREELKELCKTFALHELLAFLRVWLAKHSFEFSPGEKTRKVLTDTLKTFTVAQCCNFIWGASRDAAAYFVRECVSRRQAANSVVKRIQSKSERAIAEGWEVTPFHRNVDLPQSAISRVLFNTILKGDDAGFTELLDGFVDD